MAKMQWHSQMYESKYKAVIKSMETSCKNMFQYTFWDHIDNECLKYTKSLVNPLDCPPVAFPAKVV